MTFDFIIGVALILLGLVTLLARIFKWDKLFSKQEAMIERFGPMAGNIIHFLGYTALPLIAGVIFVTTENGFM